MTVVDVKVTMCYHDKQNRDFPVHAAELCWLQTIVTVIYSFAGEDGVDCLRN